MSSGLLITNNKATTSFKRASSDLVPQPSTFFSTKNIPNFVCQRQPPSALTLATNNNLPLAAAGAEAAATSGGGGSITGDAAAVREARGRVRVGWGRHAQRAACSGGVLDGLGRRRPMQFER
jgi:hypothetical protein